MTRWPKVAVAVALAVLATHVCVDGGLWDRPLKMDNRLYFAMAERAASGVAPHASAPDVKNQLSTLVDAASIRVGRAIGVSDVHAGRLAALFFLIAGMWGTALTVFELGATPAAATLGGLSVLAFSGLAGHASVGFNPKILLFALLAWLPYVAARGRFAAAGATAAASLLCWQPALVACLATAIAAVTRVQRWRSLGRVIVGGAATFVLYECYFAGKGVLAAQLFQSYLLPLGSVHDAPDWWRGALFVTFGEEHAFDHLGLPALAFALFVAGAGASLLRLRIPSPGRAPANVAAVVIVAVAGSLACVFTAYDHQAEPDRFLLCSFFAASMGVVFDRVLKLLRTLLGQGQLHRAEGAIAVALLVVTARGDHGQWKRSETLAQQMEAARLVAMYAEAYGSVWSWGCDHLLSLAHLDNHHPFEHSWDDLAPYVDESTFTPIAHGMLPDVIVKRGAMPGPPEFAALYVEIPAPVLEAERAHLLVRRDLREASTELLMPRREKGKRGKARHEQRHGRSRPGSG